MGSKGACFSRYQVLDAGALWEHAAPPPVELLPPPPRRAQREWERLKEDLEAPGFVGGARDVLHFADEERQLAAWSALASLRDDSEQAQIDAYLRELTPEGMVYIPAGPFLMGSADDDPDARDNEKPQHEVVLGGYTIGRYPVTNAEYQRFMEAGGYETREYWTEAGWAWKGSRTQPEYWGGENYNDPQQPVVGVSWYEAVAYCAWRGGRLPSEAQWEKAAGWDPVARVKQRYPWGDEWEPERGNWAGKVGHPSVVGQYTDDVSAYEVYEQAGNVDEWCSTRWRDQDARDYRYPYNAQDGREDPVGGDAIWRLIRGAGWWGAEDNSRRWARCGYRLRLYPGLWGGSRGFRLVAPRHLLVLESSDF